jgi:hypothetical protein
MALDFATIRNKMIFTSSYFDQEDLVNGVKKKKKDTILTELEEAYANSDILRDWFSGWINDHPTQPIKIEYLPQKFQAIDAQGILQIDPDFVEGFTYITERGKSVPYLLIQKIIHEFGHALKNYGDIDETIGFSDKLEDYQGEDVTEVNKVFEQLGFERLSTYIASAKINLQPTGYEYTLGNRIDNAVNVESVNFLSTNNQAVTDWNTYNLENPKDLNKKISRDLLIGGSLDNVLASNDGNDFLFGGNGNDILNGGAGIDTAVYFGLFKDYQIKAIIVDYYNPLTSLVTKEWFGSYTISGGLGGLKPDDPQQFKDIVSYIEYAQFDDMTVKLQTFIPTDILINPLYPLYLTQNPINDFSSDGNSDILWRNTNGSIALWSLDGTIVTPKSLGSLTNDWTIAGTGDFNGDFTNDILWRNADGTVATWQLNDSTKTTSTVLAQVSTDWKIAGTGDFNGDLNADILWRNDNGTVALWQMDGTTITNGAVISTVSNDWKIAGTGDFNYDGKSDILWRNDLGSVATWQMNGSYVVSASLTSVPSVDSNWKIAAPIL